MKKHKKKEIASEFQALAPEAVAEQSNVQVSGLEFDIPEGMIPTARTVAALHMLGRHPVVMLQFDDSGDPTDAQLEKIAGDCGLKYFREGPSGGACVACLIDLDNLVEV